MTDQLIELAKKCGARASYSVLHDKAVFVEFDAKTLQAFAAALSSAPTGVMEDVGAMEYRGNTVSFIYDKKDAYRAAIDRAFDALREVGVKIDGQTSLDDYIRRLAATPAASAQPVACLRDAMTAAAIPLEYRAPLIGHFCNALNASPTTIPADVGMTDEEIRAAFKSVYGQAFMGMSDWHFARAINAAVRAKGVRNG